jgi:hypothetical protein
MPIPTVGYPTLFMTFVKITFYGLHMILTASSFLSWVVLYGTSVASTHLIPKTTNDKVETDSYRNPHINTTIPALNNMIIRRSTLLLAQNSGNIEPDAAGTFPDSTEVTTH